MSVEHDPLIELRLSFRATAAEAVALVEKYRGTEQDVLAFLQKCAARILKQAAESPADAEATYAEVEPRYAERKAQAAQVMRQFGEKAYAVGFLRQETRKVAEELQEHVLRGYDAAKRRAALGGDMTAGSA